MKKLAVIFIGKKGSGKSYYANALYKYLMDNYETYEFTYNIKKTSLAKPLKNIVRQAKGFPSVKEMEAILGKENIRPIYQQVGDDLIAQDKFFFCKFLPTSDIDLLILDDVRYPHEIEYLYRQGFQVLTIKVVRDGTITDSHKSENSLDDAKFDLYFNTSLQATKNAVQDIAYVCTTF